ncbi:Gfo/Idh/MocA family protein [Pelomonas sp. KK5]|uniref:Gfo/Idh/MocA family protein n=1 Tax=Pelomonas sp. KK5 TaxID=1855730 RepID=UPI00097CAB71|nr:Gfo/Idh/MocA family oxidoreductase [Pelomonas sp. KK5]
MSSPSLPIRIAVAGAGLIGQAHLGAIAASPCCALSAIVDPAPAAEALAARLGVPLHRTLETLLARDRPDGIVLATPNALHVPQALACIEAGVPVLLEKPLATTVQEAEALVAEVERRGARLLVGHHRAHSPIMAKARQVVDSGQLGRLVAVMGSATFMKPDRYFAEGPWRREPGGGPILLNMIHEVHNLRMLCGEIVAVQAFASSAARGFAVEDTVAINLRFASGALGSFMLSDTAACGRSWEQTSRENPAYPTCEDEDCYVLAGTLGSLSVPTMRLRTYPGAEAASWWKPFEAGVVGLVRDDPLARQMAHFADVVAGTAAPLVTARDGLANLRVTEAIAAAARQGSLVELCS